MTFQLKNTSTASAICLSLFCLVGSVFAKPSFVDGPLHSPNRAVVEKIVETSDVDIVVLAGGYEHGFDDGMVCRVTRLGDEIGELLIVKTKLRQSAALILDLSANSEIQAGDVARIKTI